MQDETRLEERVKQNNIQLCSPLIPHKLFDDLMWNLTRKRNKQKKFGKKKEKESMIAMSQTYSEVANEGWL